MYTYVCISLGWFTEGIPPVFIDRQVATTLCKVPQ